MLRLRKGNDLCSEILVNGKPILSLVKGDYQISGNISFPYNGISIASKVNGGYAVDTKSINSQGTGAFERYKGIDYIQLQNTCELIDNSGGLIGSIWAITNNVTILLRNTSFDKFVSGRYRVHFGCDFSSGVSPIGSVCALFFIRNNVSWESNPLIVHGGTSVGPGKRSFIDYTYDTTVNGDLYGIIPALGPGYDYSYPIYNPFIYIEKEF